VSALLFDQNLSRRLVTLLADVYWVRFRVERNLAGDDARVWDRDRRSW
jgi:hypothetical protein